MLKNDFKLMYSISVSPSDEQIEFLKLALGAPHTGFIKNEDFVQVGVYFSIYDLKTAYERGIDSALFDFLNQVAYLADLDLVLDLVHGVINFNIPK